jgi:hypothetical protein
MHKFGRVTLMKSKYLLERFGTVLVTTGVMGHAISHVYCIYLHYEVVTFQCVIIVT